jgi:hypothetical protein
VNGTFFGASTNELLLVLFLASLVFLGTKIGAIGAWLGRLLDRQP